MSPVKLATLVVLTEHFLPSNTPGANRAASWARHLPLHGFYPVFFTRNIVNDEDHHVVIAGSYEVHYVKCEGSVFQRLRSRHVGTTFAIALGMLDRLITCWPRVGRLAPLYGPVKDYLANNEVAGMLVTAPSFSLFGVASRISRETGCRWIADYRDDWTTSDISRGFGRMANAINRPLERHYIGNMAAFCSVSPRYVAKIGRIAGRRDGYLVENGFEPADADPEDDSIAGACEILDDSRFNILYPGSLYDTQQLGFFIRVLECLSTDVLGSISLAIVGEEEGVVYRNNPALAPYANSTVKVYGWVEKSVADRLIMDCDAVMYVAHIDDDGAPVKGIPSSKLYEYIRHRKRVLMAPSDGDFAEYKLTQCGLAVVEPTPEAFARRLTRMVEDKRAGLTQAPVVPDEVYSQNTRAYAARQLADVLRKHLLDQPSAK